jgi:hypothetical protein
MIFTQNDKGGCILIKSVSLAAAAAAHEKKPDFLP